MKDQSKFEELVMFLAENDECGNLEIDEEITKFEDAIKESGLGEAYFGIAKSDWDRIDVVRPEQIPYRYKEKGAKFYAEYYDGFRAPFEVCYWCGEFSELEKLLKNTSDTLYKEYQKKLTESVN